MSATPAEIAALEDRICTLLLSEPVRRINFFVRGIQIRESDYTILALSLAASHIRTPHHHPLRVGVANLARHVGAEYRAASNRIMVPTADFGATDTWEKGAIVHEATHAIFDFRRIRLDAWHEEAAAFIAEAVYHRYVGDPQIGSIQDVANEIANGLVPTPELPASQALRPWSRTAPEALVSRLIAAARRSRTYRGLRQESRGFRYAHDGGTL